MDVIDRSNRPEVLGGLNPSLRVPTLVLDDGRPLGESGAILWYFGEGTALRPRTTRTSGRRCCSGCSSSSTTSSPRSRSRVSGSRTRDCPTRSGSPSRAHGRGRPRARRSGGPAREAAVPRRRLVLARRHRSLRLHACRAPRRVDRQPYPAVRAWLDAGRSPATSRSSVTDRLRSLWDFDDLDATERRFRAQLAVETNGAGRAEVLTQLARVEGLRRTTSTPANACYRRPKRSPGRTRSSGAHRSRARPQVALERRSGGRAPLFEAAFATRVRFRRDYLRGRRCAHVRASLRRSSGMVEWTAARARARRVESRTRPTGRARY